MGRRKHNDVVYLWVYTDGYQHDDTVHATVGRESTGGGFDFETGERDLEFPFAFTETDALGRAVVALAKVDAVQKVEVH